MLNLDFNLGKTKVLAKGTTAQHVFDRAQFFCQDNPDLHDIAQNFSLDMLTVDRIEVVGSPLGNDTFTKQYVAKNCLKIMTQIADHFLSLQHKHVDRSIADAILQKGTRGLITCVYTPGMSTSATFAKLFQRIF